MSTDRELLEWAAKAAGIEIAPVQIFNDTLQTITGAYWSPLTDDGDAFRLGVKVGAFGSPDFIHQLGIARFVLQETEDTAAWRRAIVCVAAEIGKGMP